MASDPKEKRETPDFSNVGLSPLAQQHYEKYLKYLQQCHDEINAVPLIVLIWGPGPAGGDLFQKRQQIRGILRLRGDAAFFSEELDAACCQYGASSRARELLQAHGADFIVVLYTSPGSIAEVHDFGGFLYELGSKMLIFIDSRHVSGYGYTGLLGELKARFNNVQTFEYPKDIDECHLTGAVQERLKDLRLAKWWAARLRREVH